jgi:predicted secreted Zn-dependent protease
VAEPDPAESAWRKSTASESGDCLEVAIHKEFVLVRHSRHPSGPALTFSHGEWAAFTTGVRNGEFDYDPRAGEPAHHEP